MTRRRWIYVDGEAIEVTLDYSPDPRSDIQVMPDIDPYRSMVNGEWITSRSRHREHLREHGLSSNNEVGNDPNVLNARPRPLSAPPGLKDELIRAANQIEERKRRH